MPRLARVAVGGQIYHVLNRAAGRRKLFSSSADYAAFQRCLADAATSVPGCRVLGYAIMPDHFHLILWPKKTGELSAFMRKTSLPHAVRWNSSHKTIGQGPIYQGRFKSFIVAESHLPKLLHYVLRNPVRSKLAKTPGAWPWTSATTAPAKGAHPVTLAKPPSPLPATFKKTLDSAESPEDLTAIRKSVVRGSPFGTDEFVKKTAGKLGLQSTLRARGRPRIHPLPPPTKPEPKSEVKAKAKKKK